MSGGSSSSDSDISSDGEELTHINLGAHLTQINRCSRPQSISNFVYKEKNISRPISPLKKRSGIYFDSFTDILQCVGGDAENSDNIGSSGRSGTSLNKFDFSQISGSSPGKGNGVQQYSLSKFGKAIDINNAELA
jgi:hypothetical protein